MNCLDYIYIKDLCETAPENGIAINDFVDISITRLARLVNLPNTTGHELASQILEISKNEAISQVSSLKSNFKMSQAVLEIKKDYVFTAAPILSDGVVTKVSTEKDSLYLTQKLNGIILQPQFNGNFDVYVSDGYTSETFTFVAINGVPKNYTFEFETKEKQILITLESGKYFSMVNAQPQSGCSTCGGGKTYEYFSTTLWNGQNYNYPVIGVPQATLQCNLENIICLLVSNALFRFNFAKLVAYIFMSNVYRRALLSERTNQSTIDKDIIASELTLYIGMEKNGIVQQGWINDILVGTKANDGLSRTIQETLKMSRDYCILCSQKVNKVNAHF